MAKPMTPEALEALKASIEKWKRNTRVRKSENYLTGCEYCPLCALYADHPECDGCPVAARTREPGCEDTPYYSAHAAWLRWEHGSGSRADAIEAAKAEVAFLESLLPESTDA